MFFTLTDQAHGLSISAGEKQDGHVYHQKSKAENGIQRDVSQWEFIPSGNGHYHIVDKRHGMALAAGERYDGHIYHQDPNGRDVAEWKLVDQSSNGSGKFFLILDRRHGKALVAGDRADGQIYHQAPGRKSNAIWRLDPALNDFGGDVGPAEFVRSEKLIDVIYHLDRKETIGSPEETSLSDQSSNHGGSDGTKVTRKLADSKTKTVEDSWSLTEGVSKRIMASITATVATTVGEKGLSSVEASVSATAEVEETSSSQTQTYGSKSTETTKSFSTDVEIPAGKRVVCKQIITHQTVNTPFTAKVERIYGNGRSAVLEIAGTHKGVDDITGEMTIETFDLATDGAERCGTDFERSAARTSAPAADCRVEQR